LSNSFDKCAVFENTNGASFWPTTYMAAKIKMVFPVVLRMSLKISRGPDPAPSEERKIINGITIRSCKIRIPSVRLPIKESSSPFS
jgi:hypothetical protein